MSIKKITLGLSLMGLGLIASLTSQATPFMAIDSIGVENKDGKEIIIHRIVAKESYYSLGRLYQVNQKDISAFNNNKRLKAGQTIKIPTNRDFPSAAKKQNIPQQEETAFTEYKVGKGETLYTIAKRFQVKVDDVIAFNNLSGKSIQPDQILRIPNEPFQTTQTETAIVEEEAIKEPSLPANRYGLTQVTDRGIGVWMEDLNTEDGKMLALHKTAPVGTIIKITNPMTQRTTYAKVVGKYNDSNDTREAIIVISKATASLLGVIDKRFLINISYGVPN